MMLFLEVESSDKTSWLGLQLHGPRREWHTLESIWDGLARPQHLNLQRSSGS